LVKNVNKETKKKNREGEGYNAVIRREKLRCETEVDLARPPGA
jgi:hypothetical protein